MSDPKLLVFEYVLESVSPVLVCIQIVLEPVPNVYDYSLGVRANRIGISYLNPYPYLQTVAGFAHHNHSCRPRGKKSASRIFDNAKNLLELMNNTLRQVFFFIQYIIEPLLFNNIEIVTCF